MYTTEGSSISDHWDIVPSTRGIVFLGTPHDRDGRWADSLFRSLKAIRKPNNDLEVLGSDSESLPRIQVAFSAWVVARNREGSQPIQITCFYEELPSLLGQVGAKAWLHGAWLTNGAHRW